MAILQKPLMHFQPQTTYETCLAVNLLLLSQGTFTQEEEIAVLTHSLHHSRDSFTLGHLDYILRHYDTSISLYIDSKPMFAFLHSIPTSRPINRVLKKITLPLIDSLLPRSPLIIYIDAHVLYHDIHHPHFIMVLNKKGNSYKIFDSWDGAVSFLSKNTLSQGIRNLRHRLKFCPQLIQFEE